MTSVATGATRPLWNQSPVMTTRGGESMITAPRLGRLSRRSSFWAVAFAFLSLTALSTAPSALYRLYAHHDRFSSFTITIVYAVYVVGVVISLILAGHVSDWYGRRGVL